MGMFNKSSSTNNTATTNNYDQRQVNDAGGGIIGNGNALDASTHLSYSTTNIGTDPGIVQMTALNDQLLGTLADQQGDAMKVIAGLGTSGIQAMGESATNLFSSAEQNSAQVWTHTLDASQEAMDKMFSAASGVLGASTSLAQGAMSAYEPTDNKTSDNQTKIAILGVIAVIVAALIQAKK